jgi:hypothetical protein
VDEELTLFLNELGVGFGYADMMRLIDNDGI